MIDMKIDKKLCCGHATIQDPPAAAPGFKKRWSEESASRMIWFTILYTACMMHHIYCTYEVASGIRPAKRLREKTIFAAYILILGLRQRFKTAADKADHGMQSKAG